MPLVEDVHTPEQITTYLECLAEGDSPDEAAKRIGSTGTRMNRFRKRDPEFDALVNHALAEADRNYPTQVKHRLRELAFQNDNLSVAARVVEVEAATHLPSHSHLRRDRVKVEQRIEHALVLTDEQLESLSEAQLEALLEIVAASGGGQIVEGEFRELTSGADTQAA